MLIEGMLLSQTRRQKGFVNARKTISNYEVRYVRACNVFCDKDDSWNDSQCL